MPREYSELLVRDSHKDYKPSVINREHYKLRQKSLLKLKTNAVEENSKAEKSKSAPPTQYEPPSYSYSAEKLYPIEKKPSLRDLAKSKRAKSGGLKTVDIEEYALEAYEINPSDKFTFAKQQNDENCPPLPNILKRSRTSIDISTRYNVQNTVKVSSGDDEVKFSNGPGKLQRALTIIKVDKPTLDEFKERYRNRNKSDSNIDPTARGTSSAETRSGSRRDGKDGRPPTRVSNGSLPKEQKSVLKLKTLEVFGDNGESISGDQSMAQKLQLNDKPYVKLDLRQSGHQGSLSRDDCFNQPSFLLSRNSKGDSLPSLTFQFNTGEVIVTRNQSVLDQDQYTKVKRNYYPKREPLKSTAHLSPVLVSRNRSVSPLKESRETHTQSRSTTGEARRPIRLHQTLEISLNSLMCPCREVEVREHPRQIQKFGPMVQDGHVWPQKPEKIEETEEENDSPVGKEKKDSPALSSPDKDSSPDKEELQAKRDTSTSMTSFVERNKLNDNVVNTVNKKGIQDSTASSENRPQVSKTNHGET
ncbi:hypothetical protein FSP39_022149 [Pinctada imbricata]|uniref:Uncharacterized protein n=1 Tax=Pinctada imbricata TaxID=66713 RepID=A0AA88Y6G5_PINIB|nr:hypothetical protein FSP39_022149 [Pinctada imbricata]